MSIETMVGLIYILGAVGCCTLGSYLDSVRTKNKRIARMEAVLVDMGYDIDADDDEEDE